MFLNYLSKLDDKQEYNQVFNLVNEYADIIQDNFSKQLFFGILLITFQKRRMANNNLLFD